MDSISADTYFIDEENEIHTESGSYHEITDYESDDICTTVKTDSDQENVDSWDVYTRYVRFYDLIQFSSIQKQLISNIVDVQLFNLCSNDIKALSEALKQNKHVTTFNLTGNKLETMGCSYLSDLLRKNRVIKHLELSRCNIDSQGAIELAESLEASALKILNLSYNKMEKAGLQSVLESLQTNIHLQELDLSYNDIRSDCVKDLHVFLEMNEKLEILNLSGNFLNKASDLSLLMGTLGALNETLQVLILQWNGISGNTCANIFKNLIIKSQGLKALDLSWNNLRDIGETLGRGIRKTTTLEDLDISYNPITTDDIVELLKSVVATSSLRHLRMRHIHADEQLEKAIYSAQSRKSNFIVSVGLYTGIKTNPVDLQALCLKRLHFLGVNKPKKKNRKVDIGHVLLNMKKQGKLEPMKKDVFLQTFKNLKIKNGEEVIEELAKAFKQKNKRIDIALMLDKYLELYPDTT